MTGIRTSDVVCGILAIALLAAVVVTLRLGVGRGRALRRGEVVHEKGRLLSQDGLDQRITRPLALAGLATLLLGLVITTGWSVRSGNSSGWPTGVGIGVSLVAGFAVYLGAAFRYTDAARDLGIRARSAGREEATRLGWRFSEVGGRPVATVQEALFCTASASIMIDLAATDQLSGEHRGRRFRATHLTARPGSQTQSAVTANIVELEAGRSVPLVRLEDATADSRRDYGARYPKAVGVPEGGRWTASSPYAGLAEALLTPPVVGALAAVPEGTTLVFRDGRVLAVGDPLGDAPSVLARLDAMGAVLDAMPADLGIPLDPVTGGTALDAYRPSTFTRGRPIWRPHERRAPAGEILPAGATPWELGDPGELPPGMPHRRDLREP